MSALSTSGLSVELLFRVIDVKYGCFTLLYHRVALEAGPVKDVDLYCHSGKGTVLDILGGWVHVKPSRGHKLYSVQILKKNK